MKKKILVVLAIAAVAAVAFRRQIGDAIVALETRLIPDSFVRDQTPDEDEPAIPAGVTGYGIGSRSEATDR